jgi:hypothetical protein
MTRGCNDDGVPIAELVSPAKIERILGDTPTVMGCTGKSFQTSIIML